MSREGGASQLHGFSSKQCQFRAFFKHSMQRLIQQMVLLYQQQFDQTSLKNLKPFLPRRIAHRCTGHKKRLTYTATTITPAAPTWFTWWYLGKKDSHVTAGSPEPAVTHSCLNGATTTAATGTTTAPASTTTRTAKTLLNWRYLCFMNAARRHWP